jgi:hypothetical protein
LVSHGCDRRGRWHGGRPRLSDQMPVSVRCS